MRKLLNTLFVLSEDAYLAKEDETVAVYKDGKKAASYPLIGIEEILCFSYKGASPALMGACCEHNIGLSFMSPQGRFLARASGESNGNVLLRRAQYRYADGQSGSPDIERAFLTGKIYNSRRVLDRAVRNHSLQIDVTAFRISCEKMKDRLRELADCDSVDSMRGIEGLAAKEYFDRFDDMILQQKSFFKFAGRNKRPPLDPVNATLSFLYTVLANDCASALESVGLDAYVGFVHRDRPGRQSLALDLMEELRPVIVDRLVLTMINRKVINAKHFRHEATGAVYLNDEGRKTVLNEWQNHKREEIRHPYLSEKIQWGLVPYVQALLLARHIRGDINGYPPFLWR